MQAGVLIPAAGPKASPDNIVEVARLAERLGYHSVWVTDHVIQPHQVDLGQGRPQALDPGPRRARLRPS